MVSAPAPPRRDEILRGIFFMLLSAFAFAGVDALVKWEVALYPIGEVAFLRSVFSLFPILLVVLPRRGLRVFRTARPGDHVKRALSQLCSMMSIFLAFRLMPLAGAIAIAFSAPLFTTLLSAVVLREKVGVHRWSALAVGFGGVLLVTNPGAAAVAPGAIFALANAVLMSTVAIAVRRMSATESMETLVVYQICLITLFTAALLPFGFTMPAALDLGLLALAGLLNGVAQYCWTKALHLAPASAVMPFDYSLLVWASIIGFAVWGDAPTLALILGSAIVVGSGLYILWRETAEQRARRRGQV